MEDSGAGKLQAKTLRTGISRERTHDDVGKVALNLSLL